MAPAAAGGAQIGAFQRVDGDIHGHRPAVVLARAHLLADVEHGRFVALALADHDGAFDGERIQAAAHGFHRRLVGGVGVAHPHGAGRGDGRVFHYAQHFQREVEHVVAFSSWTITQSWCFRPILADPDLKLLAQLPPETNIAVGNSVEAFERLGRGRHGHPQLVGIRPVAARGVRDVPQGALGAFALGRPGYACCSPRWWRARCP